MAMALTPGTRVGVYEVSAKIGEGGMGEVWQARDTTLDRDVALKVLPEAFTSDPERLARFEREAKVLASLNHPNIGTIYGLEEAEGVKALVLELVEGPTLADRIKQGPLPIDEALAIATQIAAALEAAHEQGVIHRDLKPANVKVKDDGTVKVLDFGLAKALDTRPDGDPSQSPTLTAAATQMGVIMGTAAYMSPEQARGKPVDKRADIWAFGVVLFEMLTGQRVFEGETVSETLAAVMMREPEWDRSPAAVPSTLTTLIRRCLQKDPRQRVRDIGDVRLAMEGAFDTTVGTPPPPRVEPATRRATRERVWMATTVVATLLAVALAGGALRRPHAHGAHDGPLLHRRLGPHRRWRWIGAVTGRHAARVRCPSGAVAPLDWRARPAAAAWHRGRKASVLVPRRTFPRLLLVERAQDRGPDGRAACDGLSCRGWVRWDVERGRCDRVRPVERRAVPRVRTGWRTGAAGCPRGVG